jgi:hypothetical protein
MNHPLSAFLQGWISLGFGIAVLTWTEPIARLLDRLDSRARPQNAFVLKYLWPFHYKSPESKHKVTLFGVRMMGWLWIIAGLVILALSHAEWFSLG